MMIAITSLTMMSCANMMSSIFVANSMSKPGDSPVLKSPADWGLEYKDVSFKADDGVRLSAWLIKGEADKVIIFSHFGVQCSRSGYSPKGKGMVKAYNKDIEFLNTVKHLSDQGYTVLMYDQRNHGNSDAGTCQWITGGVEESKDVIAAVKYISQHKDYKNCSIGLLSYCQGANATTYAFSAENGLKQFKNIKVWIAVQPMYNNATFLSAFGFSDKKVKKANELNLERGGKDMYKSSFPFAKEIAIPTMVVQAEKDPWTDLDKVKGYYNNLQGEKEMLWVKDIKNRLEAYDYFSHSPEKMLEWFNKYMKQ